MTSQQLASIKVGDVLICTEGNFHFEAGDEYKVQQHKEHPEYLIIECDEGLAHYVDKLNPAHWSLKEEVKVESVNEEIVWDLAEALDGALVKFSIAHPEIKITTRLNFKDKEIALLIKPAPAKEEK